MLSLSFFSKLLKLGYFDLEIIWTFVPQYLLTYLIFIHWMESDPSIVTLIENYPMICYTSDTAVSLFVFLLGYFGIRKTL